MATIITREVGATAKGTPLTNAEIDTNFINLNADIATRIPASEKGANNGVATLGSDGKVPAIQLPSYVDDVLEAANLAAFPATGETGKIYVALDTNKTYRWGGSVYVYITSGAVDSVAGKTGVVTLVKADVGLGSVDNTADSAKPVSTAQQTALNLKADLNSPTFTGTVGGITATMVGLGNVENKSSATIRGEITSANVTGALGFTPYNATNPLNFGSNAGTDATGDAGANAFRGGNSTVNGAGGAVTITGGTSVSTTAGKNGGSVTIAGGDNTSATGGFGASLSLPGGTAVSGDGGQARLYSGDSKGTNIPGADLMIFAGRGTGTGLGGTLRFYTSGVITSGAGLQTHTSRLEIDTTGQVFARANIASTSTTTGTLRVTGGVGVSGTVFAAGFNGPLTGNATNVTGTVAIANGGTGATTRQEAMDALAGAVTSGQYLRGNGTDVVMSAIQAADVPTLNQNTTGNAATATVLQTARTINGTSFNGSANITTANWGTARTLTIGNTGKSVDGSANIAWSLAEIGALSTAGKAADSDLLDGYNSDRFWRLYADSNMEAGVTGGNLNGTNMQYLLTNQVQNLLQHNAPTTYETWSGTAYVSQTVPTLPFRGDSSSKWDGLTIANGTARVRFTWINFGYRFWSTLSTACSANGNSFRVRFYTSADQTTWVERFTSGYVSNWPGYHVWPLYGGDSAFPHIRIEFEFSWTNANAATFGDIALMGAYGGYNKTFDWDYARNVFFNNAFISSNQVLHAGNFSSYALPLSGGTVTGVTTFSNASDSQIILSGAGTRWAGITWTDDLATDYTFFNGSTGTFAIGGGGSAVSGKKLHVNGGMTIGSGYATTSNPTNGLTVEGAVVSGGNTGFRNHVYYGGVRNPIWSFGDALSYGISYFQGGAGIGGNDTIGIHPNGTATAAGSSFAVVSNGDTRAGNNSYAYAFRGHSNVAGTGEASFHPAGIYSTSTNWLYGQIITNGNAINAGGGTITGGAITASGAITQSGNQVLHAGNNTSYSPSLSGNYKNIGVGGLYSRYNYNESTWISDSTSAFTLSPDFGTTTVSMHNSHGHFGGWATTLTMSGYERYGAYQISGEYNATTPQLAIRNYNQGIGGWTSWVRLLHAANISSYAVPLRAQSNWNDSTVIDDVIGLLAWKNYGNSHVIFDASNSTAPNGTSISNTNPQNNWAGTYPTLMGWNGSNTYGVRVDSSRSSDRSSRANGNFYIDDNFGCGIVGAYSSTRYQGVFAMGDSYKLPASGENTGSLYGMAWSHPNAGGAAGNLTDHGLLIINNGGFRCAISNSIVASANITAYSDERLKTNWRDMPENFVARLAQVKVGIYDRTDEEDVTQVGVSAQSFQQLLPQAIMTAKDEMKTLSVNYGGAALASAVELAKDNVELRARIERLEALINTLLNKE